MREEYIFLKIAQISMKETYEIKKQQKINAFRS